jgi:integrase/recombinase XerD
MDSVINTMDFATLHSSKKEVGSNWNLALTSFYNHCAAKNLAERTLKWYKEVLDIYFMRDFIIPLKVKNPEVITEEHVDLYIIFLKEHKHIKATTINIRLSAVRSFFNYLADNGYISHKIKISQIKEDEIIIKPFSPEQMQLLIMKPADIKNISFAKFKNWAMCCFLLDTGCRLSTIQSIKTKDIDFISREILFVKEKNRTEQLFPLSRSLGKVLRIYVSIRGGDLEDYLFSNQFGDKFKLRGIEDAVKDYCIDKLGNSGMRYYVHLFRHSMAVQYVCNSGGDILTLQKLLNHKTLSMTRRYANMAQADVKKQFFLNSPLDGLETNAKDIGRKALKK